MGRRTVLLISALVIAALGTFAVFSYVDGVDERAQEDLDPVRVLVATERIATGTTAAEAERAGAFKLEELPRKAVPDGALSTVAPISELVAAGDIFPGEQILGAKWVAAGTTDVLSIPPRQVATSVQVGDPQRVAGFVRPGSKIAIFVTIAPQAGATAGAPQTQLLLPQVTVLATGPTTIVTERDPTDPGANPEAVPTAILTLAVNQLQAQKLIYASQNGELYFALRGPDSAIAPGPPVGIGNLFS